MAPTPIPKTDKVSGSRSNSSLPVSASHTSSSSRARSSSGAQSSSKKPKLKTSASNSPAPRSASRPSEALKPSRLTSGEPSASTSSSSVISNSSTQAVSALLEPKDKRVYIEVSDSSPQQAKGAGTHANPLMVSSSSSSSDSVKLLVRRPTVSRSISQVKNGRPIFSDHEIIESSDAEEAELGPLKIIRKAKSPRHDVSRSDSKGKGRMSLSGNSADESDVSEVMEWQATGAPGPSRPSSVTSKTVEARTPTVRMSTPPPGVSTSPAPGLSASPSQTLPTPEPPSQVNNAATIIARIKAEAASKARAAEAQPEESVELSFSRNHELLSDSSEEEEDGLESLDDLLGIKSKSSSKTDLTHRSSSRGMSPSSDTLKDASSPATSSLSLPPSSPTLRRTTRVSVPSKPAHTLTTPLSKPRPKKASAFDLLVAEEDKARKKKVIGSMAAEAAKELLEKEKEEHEREVAAQRATPLSDRRSGSDTDEDEEGEGMEVDDEEDTERQALLMVTGGDDQILDILEGDREELKKRKGKGEMAGRRVFWAKIPQEFNTDMDTGNNYQDGLLQRLNEAVRDNRVLEVSLLIGRWRTYSKKVDQAVHQEYINFLAETALMSPNSQIGDVAVRTWTDIIANGHLSTNGCSILTTMQLICSRLGATQSAIEGFKNLGATRPTPLSLAARRKDIRVYAVERGIQMLATSIKALWKEEADYIPDAVLLLLLIAIDPLAPPELERMVSDTISNTLGLVAIGGASIHPEIQIIQRLVAASTDWPLAQKCQLVSILPSWNAKTTRVTAWVAYGMFLPREIKTLNTDKYTSPPNLTYILEYLYNDPEIPHLSSGPIPSSSSSLGLFIARPSRQPDYVELGHHVDILSCMMHDVRTYVEHERKTKKARAVKHVGLATGLGENENELSVLRSTMGAKNMTGVELLCEGLRSLHDHINDTRAAHLDRTVAKDAIQRLRLRIMYQRDAVIETLPRTRISDWFLKKEESKVKV